MPGAKTVTGQPDLASAQGKTFVATMKTTCGDITMDLNGTAAPQAVSSFSFLSKQNYYNDSPCHRLTGDAQGIWVLQCGDPTGTGSGAGPGYHFGVENVPANDVYPRGTVALARQSGDPNSNRDQFFIVYKDTTLPKSTDGNGYTIFGTVTAGMDIVDKIAAAGINPNDQSSPSPRSASSVSTCSRRPDARDRRPPHSEPADARGADVRVLPACGHRGLGPGRARGRAGGRRRRRRSRARRRRARSGGHPSREPDAVAEEPEPSPWPTAEAAAARRRARAPPPRREPEPGAEPSSRARARGGRRAEPEPEPGAVAD